VAGNIPRPPSADRRQQIAHKQRDRRPEKIAAADRRQQIKTKITTGKAAADRRQIIGPDLRND